MLGPLALLLRVLVVFALLGATLWLLKRHDAARGPRRRGNAVEVVGGTRVGKGANVTVVRIGDGFYALGVTEHGVSLLAETTDPRAADGATARVEAVPVNDATPSFMGALLDALQARMPERT